MNQEITVFDFDKTLTNKDSVLGFFEYCSAGLPFFRLKKMVYLLFALSTKLGLSSNRFLKNAGIRLFLRDLYRSEIERLGREYSRRIRLNKIYFKYFLKEHPDAVIASASFHEYLRPIFPDNLVLSSRIAYDAQGLPAQVAFNCFGKHKVEALKEAGIEKIDLFYTDSLSDLPLIQLAKRVFLVKNEKVIPYKK